MSSGTSYNGWPANSDKAAIGVVSSDYFPGGAKAGDVTIVLGYVARQLDARVEPFVGGWGWGYTYKANVNNPSQLSCHASGTAIDWNAPDHPNGASGTFTEAQRGQIYAILDEVQGAVSWLEGYDEMHFEICVGADDLAYVAAILGDATPPPRPGPEPTPPTSEDDGMTASIQVNGSLNVFAIGEDHRIYQQWPDPNKPGGWSGWSAGVPGEWRGGLSVAYYGDGLSLFGVDPSGRVCQVWSTSQGWGGPVPFDGITAL